MPTLLIAVFQVLISLVTFTYPGIPLCVSEDSWQYLQDGESCVWADLVDDTAIVYFPSDNLAIEDDPYQHFNRGSRAVVARHG